MWSRFLIDGYTVLVKWYQTTGAGYGLLGSNISKMEVYRNGEELFRWDRGPAAPSNISQGEFTRILQALAAKGVLHFGDSGLTNKVVFAAHSLFHIIKEAVL